MFWNRRKQDSRHPTERVAVEDIKRVRNRAKNIKAKAREMMRKAELCNDPYICNKNVVVKYDELLFIWDQSDRILEDI